MDILRFITAGSVDDGKSTLIGRLLFDTNNIKSDILTAIALDAYDSKPNLAHITDGLRTERAQGITIDVAYKYFITATRKYIITDAPGHAQFTKNLVTGASNADLVIILIDAVNGITEQTLRHSMVASFLKIEHVVVAINKMDLVSYDEQVYNAIKEGYGAIAERLKLKEVTYIPISALLGDNVSFPSGNMPWYNGSTLHQYLEHCKLAAAGDGALRLPVQYVHGEQPGIAGKVISGSVKKSDIVAILPHGHEAIVEKIYCGFDEVPEAGTGSNVVLYLRGNYQPGRGDILADPAHIPGSGNTFNATVCWLDTNAPLEPGKTYLLQAHTAAVACQVTHILNKTDLATGLAIDTDTPVTVNEFATITIETSEKIVFDASIPELSRAILIDPVTNYTSGAVML